MRTPTLLSLAIAGCLFAVAAPACINETGTTRLGEHVLLNEPASWTAVRLVTPAHRSNRDVDWARGVIANARKNADFDNLNELAVVLMRFDRPADAAHLLESVERRFPGHWQTAPNLGTAYELAGNDQQALRWIREGIRRNPDDHDGTEWLHVAILEAKLRGQGPVLTLDYGSKPLPQAPRALPPGNDGKPVSLRSLSTALQTQTFERAQFVAAPNAIMAELLFHEAHLQLVAGTMETAKVYYDAAQRYGYPDRAAIARGRAEANRIIDLGEDVQRNGTCELCGYD